MNHATLRRSAAICPAIVLFALLGTARAQLDRVYVVGSTTASAGAVNEATRNGVKVKAGSTTKEIDESEIRKIAFQGDPAQLTRAREFTLDGQYEQALEELEGLDIDGLSRDLIKTDAAFYKVLAFGKLALAGRRDRNQAISAALAFVRQNSNSYHFYSAAKLLGDLAMATGVHDQAVKYYGVLSSAQSTKRKIEAGYLTGMAWMEKGDLAKAKQAFSDVASRDVQSTESLRIKTLAKAGQAVALAKDGKGQEGLELVNSLIEKLNPTDIEMAAKIYNAQGASYEASGDIEGALLAYLHTQLMFSSQPDAHAEALQRLVELWPKVGRSERAAEARQELQQRYPGFAE